VCWEGIYVLHAGFAVFVSFIFIIICLIAALALYES
jgi:Na+-transporting methylmalonyl-CoA/oxaloacetate decarboxylase gamma subunit